MNDIALWLPALRAFWAAPVDLFFATVASFGCMVTFERDENTLESGMNEHLAKPVDIDALVLTLGRLIGEAKE